jgi:DNA-binding MarR family transcriptional regulator
MTDPFDPTECPFYLVSRASLAVTALLKRELAAAGVEQVRPSYLAVLMCLWREEGLKVVELGSRAGLEPSTMTGLLDRMERDGLVRRSADPSDRRAQRVHLTEQAHDVRQLALAVVDRAVRGVLGDVSEHELNQLKRLLRTVLANTERLARP